MSKIFKKQKISNNNGVKLTIYTDGGARGNPGPAAIGVVIYQGEKILKKYTKAIGVATNNQAEYQAIIYALERVKQLKAEEIDFFLDSELAVQQLNRQFKIKNPTLGKLFIKIWNLSQGFKKINFYHLGRKENQEADRLVNLTLDRLAKS